MASGKPFTKVSEAQRAAFGTAVKADGVNLLKSLGFAAAKYLDEHPEGAISSTLQQVERDTGALTVIARGLKTLLNERDEAAAAAAEASKTKP